MYKRFIVTIVEIGKKEFLGIKDLIDGEIETVYNNNQYAQALERTKMLNEEHNEELEKEMLGMELEFVGRTESGMLIVKDSKGKELFCYEFQVKRANGKFYKK